MKTIYANCLVPIIIMVSAFACDKKMPDAPPDQKEVYDFFQSRMKQTATAAGYLKYKLVIKRLQQAAPTQKTIEDVGTVCVFPIKVDRVEYFDNYTGTYVTTFTDDKFDLYRDEEGNLAIANHTEGPTNTEQKGRGWQGDTGL